MTGEDEIESEAPETGPDIEQIDAGERGRVKVWRRWTDEGDVPFHEYCELKPTLPPLLGLGSRFPEGEEPPLPFAPPFVRWVLRHTPAMVLLIALWYVVFVFGGPIARLAPAVVRYLSPGVAAVLVLSVVWTAILLWLVRFVLPSPGTGTVQSVIVYSMTGVLTAGLVVQMYLALPRAAVSLPVYVQEAIQSYPFAYLWMLHVGGMLVYDGMLKTENMFAYLDTKRPPIVNDREQYAGFLDEFSDALVASLPVGRRLPPSLAARSAFAWIPATIPVAYLFAAVFEGPFFFIKWMISPREVLASDLALQGLVALVSEAIDFLLIVVFFQFLVLIVYFNRLLADGDAENPEVDGVSLVYTADHHDEYAGFRDFGRFATRVNVLLVVGGIYMINYLYAGFLAYPEVSDGRLLEVLAWGVENFFPLLTYVFAVVVWFYLSFWQIHKAMCRHRERKLETIAAADRKPDPDVRNGPVWPVDGQLLVSNISLDLVPLVGLLPLIRF